jgi:hypothetical protein
VAASSNATPCFARLALAFSSSHSNRSGILESKATMGQPKPTRFVKVCSRRQWQITFNVFRRPESRPTGRRRAFHRLSQAFTFTARGGKARSAAAENVC